jgi:glutathione synthase/RimK-type ligase-like ATP-grasp enzyme
MRLTHTRRYLVAKSTLKRVLPGRHVWPGPIDDSDSPFMSAAQPLVIDWPSAVPRPHVGLVPDIDYCPYWTKYRSFLEANDIGYELFDIHRSDWLEAADRFDVVIWRPMSFPYELEECRRKLWCMREWLGILTLPSYHEALLYEDKALQYQALRRVGAPLVPSFVSHSEEESLAQCQRTQYPVVWKLICSSGSDDVELVRSERAARRCVKQVFSFTGRRTSFPYFAQKDTVYLQRFIPKAGYDLRVIAIGDCAFGYYRDVPKKDFRASGMRTVRFDALPFDVIDLARSVADKLDMTCAAVDVLRTDGPEPYVIIECGPFPGWPQNSRWSLIVDGVPGVYRAGSGGYLFEPGNYWPQHFALARMLRREWIEPRLHAGEAVSRR